MEQLALIPRVEEGEIIPQRVGDGYISATALCQSVGKQFSNYHSLKSTQSSSGNYQRKPVCRKSNLSTLFAVGILSYKELGFTLIWQST
ncbi:KilA-N domain-containing protein [Vibrio parahaemolyticus]|nr:KilA-N domain-containing protein [Vibrio parahaemolyticus]EHV2397277.1 KilA-N domain-containing protein [Vibrio parahaemolyticus]EID7756460.1 KilA-N domain-containing protein [Vibrio parahaemolyticus]EIE9569461.1 KilA-N domain-containing protein [Vibrio parahaemolyticus]EII3589738.1 KilA-N domain-containing protein [Vibrio parahaemolyticus]